MDSELLKFLLSIICQFLLPDGAESLGDGYVNVEVITLKGLANIDMNLMKLHVSFVTSSLDNQIFSSLRDSFMHQEISYRCQVFYLRICKMI